MDAWTDKETYKILLNAASAPKEDLERSWKDSEKSQTPFSQVLIGKGILKESEILETLSKQTKIPYLSLKKTEIDSSVFSKVPVKFAWYYKFFPYKISQGKLSIAVSQLLDLRTLDEIRLGLGYELEIAFAVEKDIEDMLKKHYGIAAETIDKILTQTPGTHSESRENVSVHQVEDLENLGDAASVPQLVNQILLDGYKKRASDIHLEPFRDKIRIRYRIDGVLHDAPVPAEMKKFFIPILSRIKIMANLNVIEKRLPQDGKMRVKTQGQELDLRVSSLPTTHGEGMVIRILSGHNVRSLDQLGFGEESLVVLKGLLERPNGIIFVTGPTGSGKSTTLYGALSVLNGMERKIITLEDPVEYELDGISQIQVLPEIGLTFSQGLRSVLRHDPDILMVGEVRDLETADISIRAALTGHLILSTLHTNDAASGISRLMDIGVEPYLVSSSVIAFIAQRLVRIICPHCKEASKEVRPEIRELITHDLKLSTDAPLTFYVGRGCDHCNGTGFSGRVVIDEILVLHDEIRKLIVSQASSEVIKAKAQALGMVTMRQDGWRKVLKGITTPEEVLKYAPVDVQSVDAVPIKIESGKPGEEKSEKVESAEKKANAVLKESLLKAHSEPKGANTSEEKPSTKINLLSPSPKPIKQEKAVEASVVKKEEATTQAVSPEKKSEPAAPAPISWDERRIYPRLQTKITFTYRLVEYCGNRSAVERIKDELSQLSFDAYTEDLSAGGMMCMSDNPIIQGLKAKNDADLRAGELLEVNNILDVNLPLPDGAPPLECLGKVLRLTRLVQGNKFQYRFSVEFLTINPKDRLRIENYCKDNKK